MPNITAKTTISTSAVQNGGVEMPTKAATLTPWSIHECRRYAAMMPAGNAIASDSIRDKVISRAVLPSAGASTSSTGRACSRE